MQKSGGGGYKSLFPPPSLQSNDDFIYEGLFPASSGSQASYIMNTVLKCKAKTSVTFPHLCESVKEGFGKPFTATSLCVWVLTAKDFCLLLLNLEGHAQFRNEDFCSVIKAGVQSFQH